MLHYG